MLTCQGRCLPMRTPHRTFRAMPLIALAALGAIAVQAAPIHFTTQSPPGLPRATPESVGMSGERLQAATALLRQFVTDRKVAGAVAAVARHGRVVYLEPVGLQSLE